LSQGSLHAQRRLLDYYERTAPSYDMRHTAERDEHSFALEHILMYLRWIGARSVLDSGCGTGRAIRFLRERAPDLELWGNDPSSELLEIASKEHGVPEAALTCAPSESLPYETGAFDAVVATGVLHHVADPERLVTEFLRVSRKAVFISDANIFGQGPIGVRILKLLLARIHLLRPLNWIRRGGHHWHYSEGDGLGYSFSAFDVVPLLGGECGQILVLPTTLHTRRLTGVALLSTPHVLICAFKERLS
jgi:ubiquinone/menaquinone biosynthesis C-methylase UbiE